MKKLLFLLMVIPVIAFSQQSYHRFSGLETNQSSESSSNVPEKRVKQQILLSSGEYLKQAGKCYLFGAGMAIAAPVVILIGNNNEESDGSHIFYGSALAAGGLICTIVGHTKLVKAGIALDRERRIALAPSSSGIGLALKF